MRSGTYGIRGAEPIFHLQTLKNLKGLRVSFLFAPELMTDFKGSLFVFGAAILGSVTLVLLRKTVFPAIGD